MPNWQKNFRKVPTRIADKISRVKDRTLVVGCVKKIAESDLRNGTYEHLGMKLVDEKLSFPAAIVPDATSGRYSDANANGEEIRRVDLPMTTKTFTVETPNFGDWSKGTHEVSWDRDVYQREFIPPAETKSRLSLWGKV